MESIEFLIERNAAFATKAFDAGLRIVPSKKLMIVGCVDPRVDPAVLLGLAQGEAAVLRNVGGRITPDVIHALALLAEVSSRSGGAFGPGWNLIVLHHTDCGIKRLDAVPDQLSSYLGTTPAALDAKHVHDPRASVVTDIATLRASDLSGAFTVTGLVYDVATGGLETVVGPELLRA